MTSFETKWSQINSLDVCSESWKQLERKSDCSFFLSWSWIGTWLRLLNREVIQITILDKKEIVGLGILVKSKSHSATYYLNKTGK